MWKSIIAPAVVVSLFWIIVGGATSYYLTWQSRAIDRVLEENVTSICAASILQETVWRMQSLATDRAMTRSEVDHSYVQELDARFRHALADAMSAAQTPQEELLVKTIKGHFDKYRSIWWNAIDADPSRITNAQLFSQALEVTEPCDELLKLNDSLVLDASRRRQELTNWIVWGRGAMLIVGPGLGLWMGFRLASQMNRSIARIYISLQAVAGDLEQEVGRLEFAPNVNLTSIQQQMDLISERIRHVILDLHQARKDAMRAERLAAVGELAAGVAHELRNPLTSVKLLIQTMQHRMTSNMPEETFDIVLEEISRMETTIQGLLDFARPPTMNRRLNDVCLIVQRAVNLTEGKARQNHVDVIMPSLAESAWVISDAEQIHQVCVNVLLNGIESMERGGTIQIGINIDHASKLVTIIFEDSGPGIPANLLPRLFEPFVTSKEHGTGLGLAISRRIVLNHSGKLHAANREAGGAILTIELPLDPCEKSHATCAP
ncbi:MAG: ATP-binding protein [Planctomycetaceae bacterium]